ncbi:MAG TPA: acylphosphatase [Candidatus Polarisedimenticolia bacterium]|nr:acylphosphatase [Candidatus Polarisedimenticolia bacterium]
MTAKRLLIRGIVQGVGFRYFAERAARHRGLRGWVRNLADGRVEAMAAGEAEDIATFIADLRQGPAAGRVDGIEVSDATLEETVTRFEIRH